MPEYRITEKAGRFVAGRVNNGAGTSLFLTEKEAEYELTLGTIVPAVAAEEPAAEEPEKTTAPKGGKKAAAAGGEGA